MKINMPVTNKEYVPKKTDTAVSKAELRDYLRHADILRVSAVIQSRLFGASHNVATAIDTQYVTGRGTVDNHMLALVTIDSFVASRGIELREANLFRSVSRSCAWPMPQRYNDQL